MANFMMFLGEQWVLVSVLLALIGVYFVTEQLKAGKQFSVHEVTRLMNRDEAVLLDIRDAKEYQAGHVVAALNIPFAKIDSRMTELEKYRDKTIIVVDKVGQHSASVSQKLRKAGFNTGRLRGGMNEWFGQSLPVVSKG